MDSVMPLELRKKGVALAQEMVAAKKPAAPPKSAAAKPPAAKAATPKAAAPKPVAPKVAAPAAVKPAVAASGNWRIQLGAFGQRKSAETLFARLSGKLAGRQAYYVPAGAVVRLQAGPFESRAAASAACARLAPQACFPVEAR
jgi:cell division septation protein DedD